MKAYLESVYMLTFFSWDSSKALVRAISSAFCADVLLYARDWASITLSVATMAYPAHCWPLFVKLLPSVFSSQSGATGSWSSRSGLLE